MTRLPAPLRQLCSSIALAGERWDAPCDGRVDVPGVAFAATVLTGSGGNGDDYVFTAQRVVAACARP